MILSKLDGKRYICNIQGFYSKGNTEVYEKSRLSMQLFLSIIPEERLDLFLLPIMIPIIFRS